MFFKYLINTYIIVLVMEIDYQKSLDKIQALIISLDYFSGLRTIPKTLLYLEAQD